MFGSEREKSPFKRRNLLKRLPLWLLLIVSLMTPKDNYELYIERLIKWLRKSQEEKVIEMLKREGFRELSKGEIQKEPYKSICKMPECFKKDKNSIKSS